MYIYDEGVRRSGEEWDNLLKKGIYYYNESLAGLWQGICLIITPGSLLNRLFLAVNYYYYSWQSITIPVTVTVTVFHDKQHYPNT
jgi:hypothetical protein